MTLAFYAPLKPPDHPNPSGDRTMARSLRAALGAAGFETEIASVLRTRDGAGDADVQSRLLAEAEAMIPDLIERGRAAGWRAWVTYHNYYKAPDLLGWRVAAALDIPYLLIEATRARKRLDGPWAQFAEAAETACDRAHAIFYFTERDAYALNRDAPDGQQLRHLRPFLNRADLPPESTRQGPMLAVGMMRKGDKLASYRIIAEVLALLPPERRALQIAGDGAVRAKVEALMAPFAADVTFLGALDADGLAKAYAKSSLLLWPGVNEAFGLAYLEAQAAGLPVVAQDRPGVRDALAPGFYPKPEEGPAPLTLRISELLSSPDALHTSGCAARAHLAEHHLLPAAAETLGCGLAELGIAP